MKQVEVVRAVHEPGLPVRSPVVHSFCNLVSGLFPLLRKGRALATRLTLHFPFTESCTPIGLFVSKGYPFSLIFVLKGLSLSELVQG